VRERQKLIFADEWWLSFRQFGNERVLSIYFFFSSRRRHTRSYGDWSSDVCSSDLRNRPPRWPAARSSSSIASPSRTSPTSRPHRSEERRVGKECRSRWSPDH